MRRYTLPSISSMQRVRACAASEAIQIHIHETGDSAERGTTGHTFSDGRVTGSVSREDALNAISNEEWRAWLASADIESLRDFLGQEVRTEVTFALDVDAEMVRELGDHLGRDYSQATADEVVGTTDYLVPGPVPGVWDLKTGMRVTEAKDNLQIKFAAYCLWQTSYAPIGVYGGLIYLGEDGKFDTSDTHLFTHDELSGFPGELAAIRQAVASAREAYEEDGTLELHVGTHCKYCPSIAHCPAKTAPMRAMVTTIGDMIATAVTAMTDEQLGDAWEKTKLYKPALEKLEIELKEVVKRRGIDLADGRMVRAVTVNKSDLSKKRLIEELRARGATDDDIAAMTGIREEVHCRTLGPKPKTVDVVKVKVARKQRVKKSAAA